MEYWRSHCLWEEGPSESLTVCRCFLTMSTKRRVSLSFSQNGAWTGCWVSGTIMGQDWTCVFPRTSPSPQPKSRYGSLIVYFLISGILMTTVRRCTFSEVLEYRYSWMLLLVSLFHAGELGGPGKLGTGALLKPPASLWWFVTCTFHFAAHRQSSQSISTEVSTLLTALP